MNKEEFIGKLQLVYVGDRNAFNEIVEDNQKLKNEVVYSKVEIDRLNNIIDELEKWYEQKWNKLMKFKKDKFYNVDYAKGLSDGYYKLQELKENNNE